MIFPKKPYWQIFAPREWSFSLVSLNFNFSLRSYPFAFQFQCAFSFNLLSASQWQINIPPGLRFFPHQTLLKPFYPSFYEFLTCFNDVLPSFSLYLYTFFPFYTFLFISFIPFPYGPILYKL